MIFRSRSYPRSFPVPALLIPLLLVVFGICGCAAKSVSGAAGSVRTLGSEFDGPPRAAVPGKPQLSFCVTTGTVTNPFRSRNSSIMDDAYYKSHIAEFVARGAPFESLEAAGEGSDTRECDIVLHPGVMIYVTPFGSVESSINMVGSITGYSGPDSVLMARVADEKSVEAAAARIGRIYYNAFVPGSPLYEQVAARRAAGRESFEAVARRYRESPVKPAFPEEARRFQVQAEAAVAQKKFAAAADRYNDALKIAPWWPEGHFNRALILGEMGRTRKAIEEMKMYLALVPEAPDARAAQDKIYEWEASASQKR